MMNPLSVLRRNSLWNMAVYAQPSETLPPGGEPIKLWHNKVLWRGPRHTHTRADPFLYVRGGELYLFNEAMAGNGPAWIEGYKSSDLEYFEALGPILMEPGHLSYPFVFEACGDVLLIPETLHAMEVALYCFEAFPFGVRKLRTLLCGDYVDSSAIEVGSHWFLFTTSLSRGLHLFVTDDIVHGQLSAHPMNPITRDPRFERCGGAPLMLDGKLYRPAQNCAETYGGNLSLMQVVEISPTNYEERPARQDIFMLDRAWMSEGAHHVSIAEFKGKRAVAIDGKELDHLAVHKIVQGLYRMSRRLKRVSDAAKEAEPSIVGERP
jgi:hypothetical protein